MVKAFDRGAIALGICGVIGLSTAKGIAAYRTYTIIATIVLVTAGTWSMTERRKGRCDLDAMKKERYALLGIVVSFIVVYLLLVNKVLPYLMKTAIGS